QFGTVILELFLRQGQNAGDQRRAVVGGAGGHSLGKQLPGQGFNLAAAGEECPQAVVSQDVVDAVGGEQDQVAGLHFEVAVVEVQPVVHAQRPGQTGSILGDGGHVVPGQQGQ